MGRGDRILDRAWARFTDSDRIAITDTGALIEEIEQIWGRALLSPDYKAFWIDTILEHPSRSLTKHEFLVLFKMLFEVEFEDLFDTDTDLTRRTDTRTIKRKAPAALSLVEQKQKLFQKISILKGTLNAQRKRSVDEDRTMELQLNRRLAPRRAASSVSAETESYGQDETMAFLSDAAGSWTAGLLHRFVRDGTHR
ncbi:hypothetical protein KL918_001983 [Ogataea parapolymorpha]|nr:hypothetical protein KL918_001983 [Ogataea parapolymorpha]KAG7871451.1 hypothetical protein KL916_004031 [Ogataea parapolymorpha]